MHATIALGSALIVGAFVAFLPAIPPASAQSQAQRICREQGVKPNSDAYEYCLAQVAADARNACLSYGLRERTAGLQACIDKEATARTMLIFASEDPKYG